MRSFWVPGKPKEGRKEGILFVGNFLSESLGSHSVCEDLALQMARLGWPVLTTSSKRNRFSRLFDMITATLRKRHGYKVAHVDVYSGPAFVYAELVCEILTLLKKPYILTLHGGNLPLFSDQWTCRVRRLLRSAAIVTTPSTYLMRKMCVYNDALQLLPNALELELYEFRARRNPRPRLIWLRAFHKMYNPNLAVKVLALLTEDLPDAHLTMIGPDKGDGTLETAIRMAAGMGVADRMTVIGAVPKSDVPCWLNDGDIFLNTTEVDNAPVSVPEAMACGLCVVSTNVGGIPYLLKDRENALLVPPNSPESMASAVRRIIDKAGLAASLSHNARVEAEQHDGSIVYPRWERLFREVSSHA